MKADTAKIYRYLKPEELINLLLACSDRRDSIEAGIILTFLQAKKGFQGLDTGKILSSCRRGDIAAVEALIRAKAKQQQALSEFFASLTVKELSILADRNEPQESGYGREYTDEEIRQVEEKFQAFLGGLDVN